MGACNTKEKDEFQSISTYFKNSKKINNNTQKSDFFNFTEWILSFQFYNNFQNNNERIIKLITKHIGSNEKNIFKIIKAIDQLEGKEFHEFTYSLSLQSSKSNNTKFYSHNNNNININQTHINLNNNLKNSENSSVKIMTYNDLKLILSNFIDRLCRSKMKKIKKILLIGPPNNMRWLIWISIAKNNFLNIESKIGINNSQIYHNLINCSPNPEIEKEIRNDLNNTFSNIKIFKNENQLNSLYNILKVFSLYDKEIGYKKGMNKIVRNILIVSDCNEVESFQLLRYLFSDYYGLSIREFFKDNSIKFNFYSYLIYELIRERLFPIYNIISKLQIEKEIWLDKWIITFYDFLFDFSINIRLFDCMIVLGLNFLINYTLGILKYYQNVIIEFKDKSSFYNFFQKKLKFKTDNDVLIYRERIIKLALEFNISYTTIKRIEDKFNFEMKMKNSNNMTYKHFQYSHLNMINNNEENNHEINIMKSIRNSINGSNENYESEKNDNNITNENIFNNNIKKKNNNIKSNGNKNNLENNNNNNYSNSNSNSKSNNSFNNESKNDSENENNDNIINTNKKRVINENLVDNEKENKVFFRKYFPYKNNNHKTERKSIKNSINNNKKINVKNGNLSNYDIKLKEIDKEKNKVKDIKEDDIKEEENKNEDIKNEDIKEEENKNEDIKNEEIKEEENKKKENKNEDIKEEENKNEDIKNEEIKKEENKDEKNKNKEKIIIENNEDDDSVIPIDNLDDDEDDINISIEDENKPKRLKHLQQQNT